MATNLLRTSKKLVTALNSKGYKMTISTKPFIGVEGNTHNYYTVNQAVWDDNRGKYINNALYSSTSLVRIVLYLRDLWCEVNGEELPTDQEKWNSIRESIRGDKDGQYR